MAKKGLKRAWTIDNLLDKEYDLFDWKDEWYQAFDRPEKRGVWFVWGNSGNGKTSFILQLIKAICPFERVILNSLEEGGAHTMQEAIKREGMIAVKNRLLVTNESLEDMDIRLSKRKAPKVAVIDSYQYTGLSFRDYLKLKEKHANKLLIFISQAEGKKPMGRAAVSVMYDSALKIWIEGYKAFSKGRYIGPNGGKYTIYEKGAALYHGTE